MGNGVNGKASLGCVAQDVQGMLAAMADWPGYEFDFVFHDGELGLSAELDYGKATLYGDGGVSIDGCGVQDVDYEQVKDSPWGDGLASAEGSMGCGTAAQQVEAAAQAASSVADFVQYAELRDEFAEAVADDEFGAEATEARRKLAHHVGVPLGELDYASILQEAA